MSKFDKGNKVPEIYAPYFTGEDVNLSVLTDESKGLKNKVSNVTFGKGIRNIWHSHPGGQILIIVEGEGYYQEQGKERQLVKEGDVITIGKNIIHWHGATEDSTMSHLVVSGDHTSETVEWMPELEKVK